MSAITEGGTTSDSTGVRAAIRNFVRIGRHYLTMLLGMIAFQLTGRTPAGAYQSMIALFCATGGKSNDVISRCFSFIHAPYALPKPTSGIITGESEDLSSAARTLKEKGFYVSPSRISDAVCDELLRVALAHPCVTDSDDGGKGNAERYDRERPQAVRYTIEPDALVNEPAVQKLISDPSLIWLAQEYLGSKPVLDHIVLWWTTSWNKTPDGQAAQLYHFDMDKVKFLKFFIYITDVGPQSGAHCFIQRSHRSNGIPPALLQRGYARISDDDVRKYYRPEDFVEITGPRGTILAEDTRGLHKGKLLETGDRLVFQLEFSNSLFGSDRRPFRLSEVHVPEFRAALNKYPRLYSHFDIQAQRV